MRYKYPRTYHLPFSPGLQNDDRLISTLEHLEGREVVVTEKMDGENTTLYRDHYHARSLDSKHHPSRDWIKSFYGRVAYLIADGWRVCGENLYAKHSVQYDHLKSYFYGFSIWDHHNVALNWDETLMFFETMGIIPVPQLYRGEFSLKVLHELADALDPAKQEGFVVRVVDPIPYDEFDVKVAKWVRKGHVQTDEHWMHQVVIANRLESQAT